MEIILTITTITFALVAAYYFARCQAQQKTLDYIQPELREWQNKALERQGQRPLGYQSPREPKSDAEASITPRVVTRGELEARAANQSPPTPTIHTNGFAAPKREDVIKAAAEVIDGR